MPAKSKSQRRLMGMAYAYKTGKLDKKYVSDTIKDLADTMSKKDLEDFAKTDEDDLPEKVPEKENIKMKKSEVREMIREIIRSLNEAQTDIMSLDHNTALKIIGQYEALRLMGQYNMHNFLGVQRAAFENKFYDFVNFTQNNAKAYASIINNYDKLIKMVNKKDIPKAKKLKVRYSLESIETNAQIITEDMSELIKGAKPCPNCGSKDIYYNFDKKYDMAFAMCKQCGCCGANTKLSKHFKTPEERKDKAIDLWNKRLIKWTAYSTSGGEYFAPAKKWNDSMKLKVKEITVVEAQKTFKDVQKELLKKFGNDPLYAEYIGAKTPAEMKKAGETLVSIRGPQARTLITKELVRLLKKYNITNPGAK